METALDIIRKLSPAGKEDFSGIFEFIDLQEKSGKEEKPKEPLKGKEDKPKVENLVYYGTNIVVCKGCDRKFY